MRSKIFAALTVAGIMMAGMAPAQDYPNGPVTLLHGFAPGGSADTVARLLAGPLSERLGVPVVVESKTGAGGTLASATLAQAAPDGQTIGLVTGGHAVAAGLYASLPYDTVADFTWLSTVVEFDFMLAVPADSPFQTLGDLLAAAKDAPGDIAFGSAGVGTTHHLTGLLLGSMAGVELEHVPYRGEAAAITGLLGGEIPLIIAGPVTLEPQIKAGALRALAVTSDQRWDGMPDVPTVAEAGVPGFNVVSWHGIAAPAGLPPSIEDRLRTAITEVLAEPDVKQAIESTVGGTVVLSSGEEMHDRVVADVARWTEVIEGAGLEKQ
ncbi:Bug family tripartite tricarboxylate transporter substrate binding protein [Neotabrizicola sp. VNH66]|uniref:Bug family tripartite tricarboxylate transporter substrate binding protein n=1 Tax=Neotabrizicola sp. VNH66 TaxID=3400918 RepID=UPI003BFEAD04